VQVDLEDRMQIKRRQMAEIMKGQSKIRYQVDLKTNSSCSRTNSRLKTDELRVHRNQKAHGTPPKLNIQCVPECLRVAQSPSPRGISTGSLAVA
jgi:hypothetical protein